MAIVTALVPMAARGQIVDPIIPGISVEISDVLEMPDTRGQGTEDSRVRENVARINFLRELGDGTGRWFVNDLRGYLYTVDPATRAVHEYLDFQSTFSRFIFGPGGLSTGMISVTPHPEFATNGKFYTIHVESAGGSPAPDFTAPGNAGNITQHEVILEWTASDPSADVFAGSRRELLRIATPAGFLHGTGDVAFSPVSRPGDFDYGLLYIGGGDSGYDAYNKGSPQAQRLDSLFGKILRIDPAGTNGLSGEYGIPSFNPYANDGNSATLGEIYATGFRNAHRLMWDAVTGTFFTTDIGQNDVEEINILNAGANYGWPLREGTFTYTGNNVGPLPPNANSDGLKYPVAQYDHDDFGGDAAIAGGFVYRGTSIPELTGKFVYGDIVHGRLFYSDVIQLIQANDGIATTTAPVYELFLTRDGQPMTLEDLVLEAIDESDLPANRHDLRFGQTADGEIYVITKQDGWIRRLGVIAAVEPVLAGDYNGNGIVDAGDYTVWRDSMGQMGDDLAADGNGDQKVDGEDYGVWIMHFGQTGANGAGSASTPLQVPEPAAAALCWMTALLAATGGRASRCRALALAGDAPIG